MGRIKHNAIIVTGWDQGRTLDVLIKAKQLFDNRQVSELVECAFGYYSFLIGPDGSKEGWEDSDQGDVRREEFFNWCKKQFDNEDGGNCLEVVDVSYGACDPEVKAFIEKEL